MQDNNMINAIYMVKKSSKSRSNLQIKIQQATHSHMQFMNTIHPCSETMKHDFCMLNNTLIDVRQNRYLIS